MEETKKPLVHLWCDGSCPKTGGAGGWAFVLILPETGVEMSGSDGMKVCTNNIAELRACIDALKMLPRPCKVEVFSDSQYLCYGLDKWRHGWKKKGWKHLDQEAKQLVDVKNKELWIELDALCYVHTIHANWVRGHVGTPLNERCDEMAGEAMEKFR
jgi:ribonuclease HI